MRELPAIISVDDHVIEPPDLWQRWLPERYRARGPRVERLPWEREPGLYQSFRPAASGDQLVDFWVVEDLYQGLLKASNSIGLEQDEIEDAPFTFDEVHPSGYEVKPRLEAMDVVKIERSLCFPNAVRFCGQLFLWMKDKELALACVQAYNDWIVEEWAGESGGRLLGVGLIPLWDPVAAGAEVRRNAARGVKAVAFSELPAALGLPSIHDRDGYWLPFIEACDETGTVICIHTGSSSTMPKTSSDSPKCVTTASASVNSQLSMTDWLFSGLLVRFPRLKLAFSESQIGWMPYVFERVDRVWRMGNAFAELNPIIVEPPSSYVADRVYGCFFEDDFGVLTRDIIGIDQITFECDFPHQDSTWPDTHTYIERVLKDVGDDDVYKIVRGNAMRMLGLDELPTA
jgi:predicted TIM-barrel fold metal-dependent hydrolase